MSTKPSGTAMVGTPREMETLLNVCATMYARKYAFAMRENCSNRKRGTKSSAV